MALRPSWNKAIDNAVEHLERAEALEEIGSVERAYQTAQIARTWVMLATEIREKSA